MEIQPKASLPFRAGSPTPTVTFAAASLPRFLLGWVAQGIEWFKSELFQDLAPLLWNSFGTIAALLQFRQNFIEGCVIIEERGELLQDLVPLLWNSFGTIAALLQANLWFVEWLLEVLNCTNSYLLKSGVSCKLGTDGYILMQADNHYNEGSNDIDWTSEDDLEIDNYSSPSSFAMSTTAAGVFEHGESSSTSKSRSKIVLDFVQMGFPECVVTEIIAETGEDDYNAILEAILTYTVMQAINGIPNQDTELSGPSSGSESNLELNFSDIDSDLSDVSSDLISLNWIWGIGTLEEVCVAIEKCGKDEALFVLIDFIKAARVSKEEDAEMNNALVSHSHLLMEQKESSYGGSLLGRRIRGYFHGWVVLSNYPQDVMWCIWNPNTSKMINFPSLILKDGDLESIDECCLSAPPDDPSSVFLLTRTEKPTLVFFRLNCKRKKLRWIEMSYTSQLKRITGEDDVYLYNLSCCNGKVYGMSSCSYGKFVIQLDILVRAKEVLIKLLLLSTTPTSFWNRCTDLSYYLKGFYEQRLEGVHFFKLDMASVKTEVMERFKGFDMSCKRWEEWEECEDLSDLIMSGDMWEGLIDLKDAIFFLDLARDCLVYYRPAISSELGGYIHIRDRMDKVLYSYHVKDNTISLSSMPSLVQPTSNVSVWECRLGDDIGEAKCPLDFKQEEDQIVVRSVQDNEIGLNEPDFLNLPLDILEMIIKHCVGVEYMNFRATCKRCHQAAPLIKWRDENALRRLQAYSFISPWLMVVDKNHGVITFTDPMLGDVYFMNALHVSLVHQEIACSRFGWLLFFSAEFRSLVFFNPFTSDLRKLPETDHSFMTMCFSAPPISPDCMVVGFPISDEWLVLIHYVAREPTWHSVRVDVEPNSIRFPTFFGQDLYALGGKGELIGFKDLNVEDSSLTLVETKAPVSCCRSPAQHYLIKCHQDLLKVIVGKFGERVEVFKRNGSKEEWEKINNIGKYMIYICGTTCLSTEAKMPQMENKIYFPLLYSKNKKMVFYSLETCMYHTFNGENIQQFKDFLGTTYHLFPHAWIEPSWS
ncbi:hypothetical protein CTI12_AA157140 [Artemisia annua]|uniref:Uncharacterized protein n=1 Tax=Artemisia annua TaxID=35608 RepID=A0A2U1PFC2_ARTAN|nr:hypothetical protein CTI12_AA157140 [Artemisia annua]